MINGVQFVNNNNQKPSFGINLVWKGNKFEVEQAKATFRKFARTLREDELEALIKAMEDAKQSSEIVRVMRVRGGTRYYKSIQFYTSKWGNEHKAMLTTDRLWRGPQVSKFIEFLGKATKLPMPKFEDTDYSRRVDAQKTRVLRETFMKQFDAFVPSTRKGGMKNLPLQRICAGNNL